MYTYTGLRKKLDAAAKRKDCEMIGLWQRSIINHLYWSVASTPSGDGELIKAKWLSLDNHVHNIHSGHSAIFPDCVHGKLLGRDQKKKWFKRSKYSLADPYTHGIYYKLLCNNSFYTNSSQSYIFHFRFQA